MSSVVLSAPLADLLSRVQVSTDERRRLVSLYTSSLERLRPTDRELAATENDGLSTAVRKLAEQMKSAGLSTDPLLDSYQRLLSKGSLLGCNPLISVSFPSHSLHPSARPASSTVAPVN